MFSEKRIEPDKKVVYNETTERYLPWRPNKPVDTCYSFWVGATLKVKRNNKNEELLLLLIKTVLKRGFGLFNAH